MTILVAPDSFKGTYTAAEVAENVCAGIEASGEQAIPMPVADGGEGTLDCLRQPMKLSIVVASCRNPWGNPASAVIVGVLVASDAAALRTAGSEIASLTQRFVRR